MATRPVPSDDINDLKVNVLAEDKFVNDRSSETFTDRLGVSRYTIHGMEKRHERMMIGQGQQFDSFMLRSDEAFRRFLDSSGYSDVGAYGPGLVLDSHNQGFVRCEPDGSACLFYTPRADTPLPYTTTGDWGTESSIFVVRGDDSLRQELSDPAKGSGMIGMNLTRAHKSIQTLNEFLSDLVIPLWYFADKAIGYSPGGDPATWDWGPAIIAADQTVDLISTHGGTISVREGQYGIGSTAILKGLGKSLAGRGLSSTVFSALPGFSGDMIVFQESSYSSLKGVRIQGNSISSQRGVYMPYRPDIGVILQNTIQDVQLENCGTGIRLENPVHCTLIDVRTDRGCINYGLDSEFVAGVGAGQGGTNLRLMGCWFQSHGETGVSCRVNSNLNFSSIGTQFEHGSRGLVLRSCSGATIVSPLFEDCGIHLSLEGCSGVSILDPVFDSGTTINLGYANQPIVVIDSGMNIKIINARSWADNKAFITSFFRFSNSFNGEYSKNVNIDEYYSEAGKTIQQGSSVTKLRVTKDGDTSYGNAIATDLRAPQQIRASPPPSPRLGEEFLADGINWTPVDGGRSKVVYKGAGVYQKVYNW